jgi:hypothetical protein
MRTMSSASRGNDEYGRYLDDTPPGEMAPNPVEKVLNGWTAFSGVVLLLAGCFGAINGVIALLNSHVYVPTQEGAILFDFTQWGWIHVIGGAFIALVGIVVMSTGATWARVLGILVALLQAIGMVAFIQAYPFWTIATIALDVTVIYGLLVSPYRTQQF